MVSATTGESDALLGPDDAPPVFVVNPASGSPNLLICDHAGRRIPRRLGDLGLAAEAFERHVAWDIGALDVARRLSAALDAPLVHSVYSRLVVDVNRRPDHPTAMAEVSDGCAALGNCNLSAASRAARVAELHEPYHAAIEARLRAIQVAGKTPALVSIHSFTPVFQGVARPWQVGVLWNRDGRLAAPLMAGLRARGVEVGDNQPYSARTGEGNGYTVPRHAEPAGLPHVLIEIRQNLIAAEAGVAEWAALLGAVLAPLLADPALRRQTPEAPRAAVK